MFHNTDFIQKCLSTAWPGWNIINLIEDGTRTVVYEIARSEGGSVSVRVLKAICLELADQNADPAVLNNLIERINSEIRAITSLNGHPHIAGIEEYAIMKGVSSILVMLRMEKMLALQDYICTGGLQTRDEIIRLGTEICEALDFCERQPVVHRNIKNSNLFFTEKTGFMLGDFNIACTSDPAFINPSESQSSAAQCLAPEIYRGDQGDKTADIYSLGIVLYMLLNDFYPPFDIEYLEQTGKLQSDKANARRLSGDTFSPPKNADQELGRVILKACSYLTSDRYQTASEFKDALTGCLKDDGSHSPLFESFEAYSPSEPYDPFETYDPFEAYDPFDPYEPQYEEEKTATINFGPLPAKEAPEPGPGRSFLPGSDPGRRGTAPPPHDDEKKPPIARIAAAAFILALAITALFIRGSLSKHIPTPTVKYKITYVDENGELLEETFYTGHVGDQIDHTAPDKEGYTLQDREQTMILDDEEDQNHLIFVYDSGKNGTVQASTTTVTETDSTTTTEAPPATTTEAQTTTTTKPTATTTTKAPDVVKWDDSNFEKAARNYLNFKGDLTAANAATVKKLELNGANIHSISALRYFTGLEELYLSDNQIEDISPLSKLDKVFRIHLENNHVSDLSPLKDRTNITRLDLCDNQISDLSPLRNLKRMVMLDLRNNNIEDISALKGMVNMSELYLSNNRIKNISAVAGMTGLTYLAINYNQIEDIRSLKSMSKLAVLTMRDNKIRDISVLRNCPLIYHLKILNNPIQDYSPLKIYKDSVYIDYYDD